MKKILLGLMVFSITGIVFADEVRVFNERSYTYGGAKEGKLVRKNSNDKGCGYRAETKDAHGKKNQNIQLDGKHHSFIYNESAYTQRYHFKYNLESHKQGYMHEGDVEIPSFHTWNDDAKSYVLVNMNHRGQWPIYASTIITGFQGGRSDDQKHLTVVD